MPHDRSRHLTALLEKSLRFSPIVGVFGHRQVGKTTLAASLGGPSGRYITFDDRLQLEDSLQDPETFLKNHSAHPLILDECQLSPPLFPAMKEWVRTHPRPGQLLLTGSVRFSSRKLIRESLTGRMIAWELLPMDLSEAHSAPLPNRIPSLLDAKTVDIELKAAAYATGANLQQTLHKGGLPGIFAVRDGAVRAQRFDSILNAILERDLSLIQDTTLGYSSLLALLRSLALNQCRPLQLTSLSRQTRISIPSIKKLITAFQALFLIRLIPTEGTEKKPVLYFEDQGEATFLASDRYDDLSQLERLLYSQLRVQSHYRPEAGIQIFQFRNRGGAMVPLCFRKKNSVLGIIPILTELPETGASATARSFLAAYPDAKILFAHRQRGDRVLSKQIRSIGINQLV